MTVLVTGGSGVLGLHTCRALAEEGEDVVSFSTSGAPATADSVLGDHRARVRFVQGDIRDFGQLYEVARRLDAKGLVHTAALTGDAQARAKPLEVFAVNVGGTANALEVARLIGMRRVVYISSASEYGRREDLQPIKEDEVNIERMYPETKFLGHSLGQRYHQVYGLDVVTVRVSSVYGPNTRFNPLRRLVGNTLIAHMCRAAARGEAVKLESGGDYPRDWTYAADTARGVALAYRAETLPHRVYNVASGRSHTIGEVAETIRRIEPGASIEVGPGRWDDDPFQAGNLRGPLDTTRARMELGFEPRFSLEDGLRAYIEWWRHAGQD